MEDFKVIIAGCRDFSDYDLLREKCLYYLQNIRQTHNVVIVSGHASGADALGERFATEQNFQTIVMLADWDKYGRSAGPKRNTQMAEVADALIAFWDGQSRGTKNMIEIAKQKGLNVKVVNYNNRMFIQSNL